MFVQPALGYLWANAYQDYTIHFYVHGFNIVINMFERINIEMVSKHKRNVGIDME